MPDQIKKEIISFGQISDIRLIGYVISLMVAFLFVALDTRGQCQLNPSNVQIDNMGLLCPDQGFHVSLQAFRHQTYNFFHNGQPIPGYQNLSISRHGPQNLQYQVNHMSLSDAGSYSVITYDDCGDSLILDSVFAYYGGIAALSIDVVNGNGASFHWIGGSMPHPPPGDTYTWAIDNTNTFPQSGNYLFSGNTQDTFAHVTGLLRGTTYYVFVSNDNSNCHPGPVWTENSFTTPSACSANFDSVPIISSNNSSFTICPNGSIVLQSNSSTGNQWFKNGILVPDSTKSTFTTSDSGAYSVMVTDKLGCHATSAPKTVRVSAVPTVPTITASGPLTFCSGGSVVLTSSSANSYAWFRNGTGLGLFAQNLTVASPGNYSVQVNTVGGCVATSGAATVNVNPIPPVPTISGPTVLNSCTGEDAVNLQSSAQTGNQWMSSNSPIPGEINSTLIVRNAGNYSVQVTGVGQCSSVSASTEVTVIGSSPQPTINPSGTIGICSGGSTLLTSSLTSGNQWYKDGVALAGDTLQKLNVSVSGNYTVFGGTGLCASQSLPTIVNSSGIQGTPEITVNGSLTICEGGSIILHSSASDGNQWYFNGQALFGENDSVYSASAAGIYIVSVGSGSCQVFSTAAIVSVVANSFVPVITSNGTDLCAGRVFLQSSADSGNVWYLNTVLIPGANGNIYVPTVPGNYAVQVGSGSNCASPSESIIISGFSGAIPKIKITNGVLSSDSLVGNQWYRNDTLIPGANGNTYTPRIPGSYTVRVNHRGCLSDFSSPLLVTENDLTTPSVSVFPNPATDLLYLINKGPNPIMVQLYDMAGRGVLRVQSISGTYQLLIDRLTRGPYYILITDQKTKNKTRMLILKL